jgi:type II restriction/modification system DNA methylase subunit YeeA
MTPHEFIAKWRNGGDERRDAQPFFEDLCRLVGHPTPREADPEHTWFTYEYGATKTSGGEGWADVWKKGYFGWEAKGTHRSLDRAYEQLKMYADALQNPPLLVVSDLQTIIVHTNFTNTVKREYRFTVEQLAEYETRQILEAVFKHPDALRPGITRTGLTQEAAEKFTTLAKALRDRGHEPQPVAHFLNRLLFCMFAEDIGLLPPKLFTELVENAQRNPALFEQWSAELFRAMTSGGTLAFKTIEWFNGGLFDDDVTLRLEASELKTLLAACQLDWSEIEPSIFGTLFERGLDPNKRSQLGAHYTDPETIMKIVRPVIVEPWLQAWEAEKAALAPLLARATKTISKAAQDRFAHFLERLRAFRVLDPACGSGNFLYLALRALKDIEKRVLIEGESLGLGRQFPGVGPASVKGIELNEYAAELARITVWIGEIQWMVQNGYGANRNPILQALDQIENHDALLSSDGTVAVWPAADAVIGNPPFVGDKKMKGELGQAYSATLRAAYKGRVAGGADLVCYWFHKAVAAKVGTIGFVASNLIRRGRNRQSIEGAIAAGYRIVDAWEDEEWHDRGTAVRVSMVCLTKTGSGDVPARLNGEIVSEIYPDLTGRRGEVGTDLSKAVPMKANKGASFNGLCLAGDFDIDGELARSWLAEPNPNGKPNSDVLFPLFNGEDITQRTSGRWIVDFGCDMSESEASLYEKPFQHVMQNVKPGRMQNARPARVRLWWRHGETRPGLRKALTHLNRFIITPETPTHRFFEWLPKPVAPDHMLIVIARDDDTSFGILSSSIHETWARAVGSPYGNHPTARRYSHSRTFQEFPFPERFTPDTAAADYATDPHAMAIALSSRALVEARDRWLNPPEWVDRVPEVVPGYPDRIIAKPGHEADLKKRTLTNLYNARPAWLANLHADLDAAVAAAYGWPWPLSDDEILRRLFELNQARSGAAPTRDGEDQ